MTEISTTGIILRFFRRFLFFSVMVFVFISSPISVTTVYAATATLTWTAPGDDGNIGQATQYDIRYATFSITDANWAQCTVVPNPPSPLPAGQLESFEITGLNSSTTYYFAVKTVDEAGNWSGLSNIFNITTDPESEAPAVIADFSVGGYNSTSVTLNWTAPGDDGSVGTASVYDIRYYTSVINDGNWNTAIQVAGEPSPNIAGSSESFTVTGLNPNTTYYFAIKTADEVPNWSNLSNVVSQITALEEVAPAVIADFNAVNPASTSITLTWTAVGDDNNSGTASQYDIRYSTSTINNGNWNSAAQVTGEPLPKVAGSSESFVVNGLVSNITYYFAIKTADEVPNWSGLSNIASNTTTVEQTAPSVIADLITLNPTESTITLSWTAVGDDGNTGTASVYDIRYSKSMITSANWNNATQVDNEPVPQVAGTVQSCTVYGLDTNTVYYFAMKVADEVPNWSGMSAVVIRSTLRDETPPAPIMDLQAVPGSSSGSINISWTPPQGVDILDYFDGGGQNSPILASDAYIIRYSTQFISEDNWDSLIIFGDTNVYLESLTPSSATISGLQPGMVYYLAVKTKDENNNISDLSNVVWSEAKVNILTDINDDFAELPAEVTLSQNYPNPFNPNTSFDYSVPSNTHVKISIYNSAGQKTKTVVDETKSAGYYTAVWDGTNDNNSRVASGIYLYKIQADNYVETKKMVLLK